MTAGRRPDFLPTFLPALLPDFFPENFPGFTPCLPGHASRRSPRFGNELNCYQAGREKAGGKMRWPQSRPLLDIVANVGAIGTCALVCSLLVVQLKEKQNGPPAGYVDIFPVGQILTPVADVSYGDADLTVLVGLNSTCHFCAESMPEFRRLDARAKQTPRERLQVFAVDAEPPATLTKYLQDNALGEFRPITIDRASPLAPVAMRTPSLVLVNRMGAVLGTWPGRLTGERMNEVLQRLDEVVPSPKNSGDDLR